jgi:hypothetical protein
MEQQQRTILAIYKDFLFALDFMAAAITFRLW